MLLLVGVLGGLSLMFAARAEAFVYWANQDNDTIGFAGIDGTGPQQDFITGADTPCGVAVSDTGVSFEEDFVYWANSEFPGSIGRAQLDGTDVDQTFITGTDNPCGVAVDDEFVYWANQGGSIGRAELDGTDVDQAFIAANAANAVAVDDQFVYWTNFTTGTIGRADLDGTNVDQSFIPAAAVADPTGVAVDDEFVYWTNAGGQTIGADTVGRADIDGSSPDQSFVTGLTQPCGVTVDDSFIYWGNNENATIGRADLDGTDADENFIQSDDDMVCGVAVNPDFPLPETSPSSLAFGDQLVGTTSPSQDVTITNSSTTSIDLEINEEDTTDLLEFGTNLGCQFVTLAPGQSCTTSVEFSPTSVGGKSAFLSLGSNAGPILVPLTGTGTDPDQTVSPTSLSFGGQIVGTTSSPKTVTLTNGPGASADDEVGQVEVLGANANQFSIVSDECSNQTLPIGGSCQVAVDFGPTSTGDKLARLRIPSTTDPPETAEVALSGTGTTPDEDVSPTTLQFGESLVGRATLPQTITVANTADATADLRVDAISLAGADPGEFGIVLDTCSNETLPPGDDCRIGVNFDPTAPGAAAADVQIPSNGSPSPVNVSLGGTGTFTDQAVSPGSIEFGTRQVGVPTPTRSVTVANRSSATATLTVGSSSVAGPDSGQFDIVSDGCFDRSLAPGDECRLGVRFAPTTVGAASAHLRIPTDAPTSPAIVSLEGTGASRPSNEFTLGKARKNKRKGTAKLPVEVPGGGTLDLAGAKVRSAHEETIDSGVVILPVKAKRAKKRKLKKKGRAKVGFEVTYTPIGGDPSTQTDRVKLVKRKRR